MKEIKTIDDLVESFKEPPSLLERYYFRVEWTRYLIRKYMKKTKERFMKKVVIVCMFCHKKEEYSKQKYTNQQIREDLRAKGWVRDGYGNYKCQCTKK